MMMKYTLFISAMTIILFSCGKEGPCMKPEKLDGYHSLTSITCECPFIEINSSHQQWKFDFKKSKIDVFITCEDLSNKVLDEGTYDFKLIDIKNSWGGDEILFQVNDKDFYIDILNDKIQLSDLGAAVDAGSYYTFSKN